MLYEHDGFRFDMGPSWYLMPDVFERFFEGLGVSVSEMYTLRRLVPAYKVFFPERSVSVSPDLTKNLELFDSLEPNGGAKLTEYLTHAKYLYDVALENFIYKTYKRLSDFFTFRLIKEAPRLQLFSSLDSFLRRRFSSEEARQLLSYNAVFLGSDPRRTPALYALMSHVDMGQGQGVYYPEGGLFSVVTALETLCKRFGATIHYNEPATKIELSSSGKAKAVITASRSIEADVVVSAADYHHTETTLLPEHARSYSAKYWSSRKLAPSALLIYLGVNGRVPNLEHHTLYFRKQWERHFDTIFVRPSWPDEPCYYVCAPSKTDPTVAPEGCENLFILVPVAAGLEDDDAIREQLAARTISHLEGLCGDKFSSRIRFKRIVSHRDFSSLFNSLGGSALGLAHTLLQTALFRPSMRSKRVENLFYTGHYTHPGIGVPMVLISSTLTAREINDAHPS
jgi:phytoene desaturase